MSATVIIRPATPGDAPALTAIAVRSKAHWGYDDDFMAAARIELTVTEEKLSLGPHYVAEVDGFARGFYGIGPLDDGEADLLFLFVEPSAIGTGLGRALLHHALETATAEGYTALIVDADPFAADFYAHMGGLCIGQTPSASIPGRRLPQFRFALG